MVLSRKLKLPKIRDEDNIPMTDTANTSELTNNDNKNEENKPMLSKNITLENEIQRNSPNQAKTSKKYIKDGGKNWSNVKRKKLILNDNNKNYIGCAINNDKKFLAKYVDVLELKHAHIIYIFIA